MLNINITLISCLLAPTQSFRFHSLCLSTLKIQENCLPSSHCVLAVKKLLCFLQRSRCEIIKENWYVSSCQQAFASHSFYTHFSILFYPLLLKTLYAQGETRINDKVFELCIFQLLADDVEFWFRNPITWEICRSELVEILSINHKCIYLWLSAYFIQHNST